MEQALLDMLTAVLNESPSVLAIAIVGYRLHSELRERVVKRVEAVETDVVAVRRRVRIVDKRVQHIETALGIETIRLEEEGNGEET